MNRYKELFPKRHSILAVIHVVSETQARTNVAKAEVGGCDGCFLISHGDIPDSDLVPLVDKISKDHPYFWIGVNLLSKSTRYVFDELSESVKGVWVDNAEIDERGGDQVAAEEIFRSRGLSGWNGLYFGGVAFKYQRSVSNDRLQKAADIAAHYVDVVTTSGRGTGHAAHIDKIAEMKKGLGDTPLAIASGITPENVAEYMPYADYFIVATGIGIDFYTLCPEKIQRLVEAVRG